MASNHSSALTASKHCKLYKLMLKLVFWHVFAMGTTLPVPSLVSTSDTLDISPAAKVAIHGCRAGGCGRGQMTRLLINAASQARANLNMEYQDVATLHQHHSALARGLSVTLEQLICRPAQAMICRFNYPSATDVVTVDEVSMGGRGHLSLFGPPSIFFTLTAARVHGPAKSSHRSGQDQRRPCLHRHTALSYIRSRVQRYSIIMCTDLPYQEGSG